MRAARTLGVRGRRGRRRPERGDGAGGRAPHRRRARSTWAPPGPRPVSSPRRSPAAARSGSTARRACASGRWTACSMCSRGRARRSRSAGSRRPADQDRGAACAGGTIRLARPPSSQFISALILAAALARPRPHRPRGGHAGAPLRRHDARGPARVRGRRRLGGRTMPSSRCCSPAATTRSSRTRLRPATCWRWPRSRRTLPIPDLGPPACRATPASCAFGRMGARCRRTPRRPRSPAPAARRRRPRPRRHARHDPDLAAVALHADRSTSVDGVEHPAPPRERTRRRGRGELPSSAPTVEEAPDGLASSRRPAARIAAWPSRPSSITAWRWRSPGRGRRDPRSGLRAKTFPRYFKVLADSAWSPTRRRYQRSRKRRSRLACSPLCCSPRRIHARVSAGSITASISRSPPC